MAGKRKKQVFHAPESLTNDDLELSVLGQALGSISVYRSVVSRLSEPDFYTERGQIFFRAITEVVTPDNSSIDLSKLSEYLKINGVKYSIPDLMKMKILSSESGNVDAQIDQLIEYKRHRDLYAIATDMIDQSTDMVNDGRGLAAEYAGSIHDIIKRSTAKVHTDPPIFNTVAKIKTRMDSGGDPVASTTFSSIDSILCGGWDLGSFNVLAARSGEGKTAFTMCMALRMQHRGGSRLGYISMEMTEDQMQNRELSMLTGIPYSRMKSGNISDNEYKAIALAAEKYHPNQFSREYCGQVDTNRMIGLINKLVYEDGCTHIVIDYLQRALYEVPNGMNEASAIGRMANRIAAAGKQANAAIIALSQLKRPEKSTELGKRPTKADIRASGMIEEAADSIVLLHRPDYYSDEPIDENGNNVKGITEFIIEKNRDGSAHKIVRLHHKMEINQYYDPLEYNNFEQEQPARITPNREAVRDITVPLSENNNDPF